MKALTICQPYAHLIVTGAKRVENRRWYTHYRGPLVIHAGKSRDWLELDRSGAVDEIYDIPVVDMAFGAIVGKADLVACLNISQIQQFRSTPLTTAHAGRTYDLSWLSLHEHTEGPYCLVLENVYRLPAPIPWKGAQGLFDIPYEDAPSLGTGRGKEEA